MSSLRRSILFLDLQCCFYSSFFKSRRLRLSRIPDSKSKDEHNLTVKKQRYLLRFKLCAENHWKLSPKRIFHLEDDLKIFLFKCRWIHYCLTLKLRHFGVFLLYKMFSSVLPMLPAGENSEKAPWISWNSEDIFITLELFEY